VSGFFCAEASRLASSNAGMLNNFLMIAVGLKNKITAINIFPAIIILPINRL
jgi:hypothetical protein